MKLFDEILTNIRREDWVVFLASKSSLENENVDKRIEKVVQARRLVPVSVDEYLGKEWDHYLRNDVLQLRIVSFAGDEPFDEKAAEVVEAIKRGEAEYM